MSASVSTKVQRITFFPCIFSFLLDEHESCSVSSSVPTRGRRDTCFSSSLQRITSFSVLLLSWKRPLLLGERQRMESMIQSTKLSQILHDDNMHEAMCVCYISSFWRLRVRAITLRGIKSGFCHIFHQEASSVRVMYIFIRKLCVRPFFP